MKAAIGNKGKRNLGGVLLLTLLSVTGWVASPDRFRTWFETTTHAATTFTVDSSTDLGDLLPGDGICKASNDFCTLRAAIQESNALPGLDTINIDLPCRLGCIVPEIRPGSALPTITGPVIIDATGQSPRVGRVWLNGTNAGSGARGLLITGGGSTVRGLVISNFGGNGIEISGGGGNVIEDNYIGTDFSGTAAAGNATSTGLAGVYINNSSNNTIGSTATAARNVISGNGGSFKPGVRISGTGTGNRVVGNYIGTNVNGMSALPNSGGGVETGAASTTIGGTTPAERNVISGNNSFNVLVSGPNSLVQGNYIGTNRDGSASLTSTNNSGIVAAGALIIGGTTGTTPGGPCTGACNVVSGNGTGIYVAGGGVQVQGNYIGTDVTGMLDVGNSNSGVFIEDANNVIIGGTTPAARNIISGNNEEGVKIAEDNIAPGGGDDNIVQGNYIGITASGMQTLGNSRSGVLMGKGASRSVVGGTTPGAGNVISGNGDGISIDGSQPGGFSSPPSENRIEGNFIGTNADGTSPLSNTNAGVKIFAAANNTVGGTMPAARNVISGNGVDGIQINGTGTRGNAVLGNFIGTDANGTLALRNTLNGVVITDAPSNTIGGTISGARNIVSGNDRGVQIQGPNATGNQVLGNYIGTDVNGTSALPNSIGVLIDTGASSNTIGGTTAGARNLLSGNGTDGIRISGALTTSNIIQGNFVGTKVNGTESLPNGSNGVRIEDSPANTIGGITATPGVAPGNLIAGNASNGVYIFGDTAIINLVQGNLIGSDVTGALDVGNNDNGVLIEQGKQNTLGGTVPGSRNIISGNNANGVEVGDGAEQNVVQGNLIGTNAAGALALGNSLEGVRLTAPKNIIGGATAAARNVISGNNRDGIRVSGTAASENEIQGNFVGTAADGVGQLGNAEHGVQINNNGSKNMIGGTVAGAGNTVAFNGGDGVSIQPGNAATNDNSILSNAIFSNTGLGIDLFPDGVTGNDAGDADSGANNLQNFPILTSAIAFTGSTTVAGTLNSTANTTFRLELFANVSCDSLGNGEGQSIFGSLNVTTDSGGNASFTVATLPAVPAGRFITATATDPTGNTSEFSQCLQARATISDLSINMVDSPDPVAVGGTLTYTITLINSGPEIAEAVVVTDSLPSKVTFISCTATAGGVCAGVGNDRTVTISSLAPNEMTSITFVTVVNSSVSGDTISNTATVISAASDPNAANNSVTIMTTVPASPTPTPTPTPVTLQFSASIYSVVEDCTSVTVTVTRAGPATGAATVDYSTANATASDRSDYTTALGTLRFAAGEISKSFDLLINEDSYVEGTETATIVLSNPAGAVLDNPSTATLEIVDDATEPATNPIDEAQNFACQTYHDFLNRQPDAAGLAFWTNQITECGADTQCIEIRRINVSAAFFVSIEFQETGYLVYRFHQATFGSGPLLRMRDFLADTQEIGRGVVVGAPGWELQLESNKRAYADAFVARPQFVAQHSASSAAEFVDALNASTLDPQNPGAGGSLSQSERDQLVRELEMGTKTRAEVLGAVSEDADFRAREFNRAFVYMQYLGYLRRNPNDAPDGNFDGYNFWLGKLNQFNGNFIQAEMVKAFILSSEYRGRFAN